MTQKNVNKGAFFSFMRGKKENIGEKYIGLLWDFKKIKSIDSLIKEEEALNSLRRNVLNRLLGSGVSAARLPHRAGVDAPQVSSLLCHNLRQRIGNSKYFFFFKK